MNKIDKFSKIDNTQLNTIIGGNIFSQVRDTAWSVIDGWQGVRHNYQSRHRG